jgi:hypothetical protein
MLHKIICSTGSNHRIRALLDLQLISEECISLPKYKESDEHENLGGLDRIITDNKILRVGRDTKVTP